MTEKELKAMASEFVTVKAEADKYKKQVENLNTNIKQAMELLNADSVELDDGSKVVYSITKKTSLDEEKLLKVLNNEPNTLSIKTKQCVDMDILESEIYHDKISSETLNAMEECRIVKEIPTLTIKKAKKGK